MLRTRFIVFLCALVLLTVSALPTGQVLAAPAPEGVLPPLPEQAAAVKIETITTRQNTTCAIKTDGTLTCWGNNDAGKASPPTGTFTQVTLGWYSTCGLKTDGTVACWGETANNQNAGFPTGQTFTQISSGEVHTCGIKTDGTLYCWGGFNGFGETTPPSGTYTQVATGWNHACAIKTDGTLACWGAGTTNTGTDPNRGQAIAPSGTFIQVSAGWYNTCGLKTDGSLLCWGDDSANQVSNTPSSGSYIQVSTGESGAICAIDVASAVTCWGNTSLQGTPPSDTFTQITLGAGHACGLRTDGQLICWGDNTYGQSTVPAGVSFGRSQISLGNEHTCWLKNDGSIACWGSNTVGQSTPPLGTYAQVSTGFGYTCAIKTDGTLACWGNNGAGVSTPPGGTFTQVSTGWTHACAIKTDGTLACWGSNDFGEGTPPGGTTFTQISAEYIYTCGVKTDGTLACWGDNSFNRATPPGGTYTQVSTGFANACAINTDGTLACWGAAGGTLLSDMPSGTFTQLSVGSEGHACAIRTSGALVCWGNDDNGQVSGKPGSTFTQVSAGAFNVCGIQTSGMLVCWGMNDVNQTLPVTISGHTTPDVILHYSDGVAKEVTSDSNGDYSFKVSYGWTGIVSPSLDAYPDVAFTPPSRLYENIISNQTTQDYHVTLQISGNAGADGVALNYDDGGPQTATADGNGDYTLAVTFDWSGTVTPSKTGVIFTSTDSSYNHVTANASAQNYTAAVAISGNAGAPGVTLNYINGGAQTATSDINGDYSFNVPYNWTGTVTPTLTGVNFSPANIPYASNLQTPQTAQNYTASITISGNAGANGATISYNNGGAYTTTTNSTGDYSFTVPYNWPGGTVTPSKTGVSFVPASRPYSNVIASMSAQNYAAKVTLSGRVGTPGASLAYVDGTAKTVIANASGNYTITVPYKWSGTVTPSKSGLTFSPASRTYSSVQTNQAAQNYVAIAALRSIATQDGWILESTETSGLGGTMNATTNTFRLGDDASNRQYRAILSFDTGSLPDNAVIQSAILTIKQSGAPVGVNPFIALHNLLVDVRNGPFKSSTALQLGDFNAPASAAIGPFSNKQVGGVYTFTLSTTARNFINKASGVTQFRLYFTLDDNNNHISNYINFFSGNASSGQPQLTISYTLP